MQFFFLEIGPLEVACYLAFHFVHVNPSNCKDVELQFYFQIGVRVLYVVLLLIADLLQQLTNFTNIRT